VLQISLPLDSDVFTNIKAPDGMIANAGKNHQVTFTVMPEQEEELVAEADAAGFQLDGIDITAVPSSMSIDGPDAEAMTGDMKTLSDAIADINNGIAQLNDGVSELNNGAEDLQDGSEQYKNGISSLDEASAELVNGSEEIEKALSTINESLGNVEEMDLSGLEQFVEGLTGIADGLGETAEGLTTLKQNYKNAYDALDTAMTAIPSYDISEEDVQALYESGADQEVVGKLVETYSAAQVAKGTYAEVKQGFDAVEDTLQGVRDALAEMDSNLDTMANELASSLEDMDGIGAFAQLQEGIAT